MKSVRVAPATAFTSLRMIVDICRKRAIKLNFMTKLDSATDITLNFCSFSTTSGMSEKCLSLTSFSIAVRAHNQRLRLIKEVLLSLSRERKRAGSPDDPQHGWLFQGTNAWATAKGTSYGEQNTGRTLSEIMRYKRACIERHATNSPRPQSSLKRTRTSSNKCRYRTSSKLETLF